jgi:hypothetical protein
MTVFRNRPSEGIKQDYVRKEVNQTGAKFQLDVAGQKRDAEIVDCRRSQDLKGTLRVKDFGKP